MVSKPEMVANFRFTCSEIGYTWYQRH